MKKYSFFLVVLFAGFQARSQTIKALFIGNSYTYVNDLPGTVAGIATSKGDTLLYDSSTPGGYTLQLHSTNATSLSKIASQQWNYVVLQEQSQLPSFDPAQVATDVYPYANLLDSIILANDSCSETLFYMTWGRQNGDASNCASYPPVCTYDGMQQRLRESYLEMGLNNHASVSPVGAAWKQIRDNYPSINLYQADESHPSVYGTYLAACVFYSSMFHTTSVGSSYVLAGISASDALILQTVGSSLVIDSLTTWQGNGDVPCISFTPTAIHENKINTFTIYPNPAQESVTIKWNKQEIGSEILVKDISGNIVKRIKFDLQTNAIPISDLQNGTYFISVETKMGPLYARFIIAR